MDLNQIKIALDAFVAQGGNIDELGNNDKLYRQIKDSDIFENGVRLSVEEKFKRAGPTLKRGSNKIYVSIINYFIEKTIVIGKKMFYFVINLTSSNL